MRVLLWGSVVLWACQEAVLTDKDTVATAYVTTVEARDVRIENYRVAEIVAFRNVEIRNRLAGYLMQVSVDEGERIPAGRLMFTFNADEAIVTLNKEKANLRSTEADREVARLEVERLAALVQKRIISASQLEIARAKLIALDARVSAIQQTVALAALRASYANIYAPFSGVVDRIPYKSGSYLNAGVLLTTLSDISKVYAYFYVSEGEYLKIFRKYKKAHGPFDTATQIGLILSDGSLYRHKGVIQTVAGSVENNTGSIALRAIFPNPEHILQHGASAKVVLPIHLSHALVVPKKSVLDIQSKKYVYRLKAGGFVTMQPFSYTHRYKDYFIVDQGLQAGDSILYEGLQRIKAQTRVQAVEVSADSLWRTR